MNGSLIGHRDALIVTEPGPQTTGGFLTVQENVRKRQPRVSYQCLVSLGRCKDWNIKLNACKLEREKSRDCQYQVSYNS